MRKSKHLNVTDKNILLVTFDRDNLPLYKAMQLCEDIKNDITNFIHDIGDTHVIVSCSKNFDIEIMSNKSLLKLKTQIDRLCKQRNLSC